jgi:carboxyl-terminal processing protease
MRWIGQLLAVLLLVGAGLASAHADKRVAAATSPDAGQLAQAAPIVSPAGPPLPRLTKADVVKLFKPFASTLEHVRSDYVEVPDDKKLLSTAIDSLLAAFPSGAMVESAGYLSVAPSAVAKAASGGKIDLNVVYDLAIPILNEHRSQGDDARLVKAAINGMLAALDPHSSYMDAKSFRDIQAQTRGEFGGLGVEVVMEDGLIKVVAPIDETPAAKGGVLANDIITHLDDEPVRGLTLIQAVDKMRGPVKTKIKLRIMRKGQDKPIEISLIRDVIRVIPVRSRLEGDDVGYIRISQFNKQTTQALTKAVADISSRAPGNKLKGYVLDLRTNPGGLLDQAVSVSDAFLEKGEIVSTRGRNANQTHRFNARPGDLTKGKPVIVLINGGTASASEIVAGALQDHRRATVIGTRSFGKGSLQTIIPLGTDNGALRLTTARYFTPAGHSIQANGISPDIEALQDVPEDLKSRPVRPARRRCPAT